MKNAPLDSVKMFVSGADALPDKIRAGFGLIYGRKICAGYGLTEASPVIAVNNQNDELATNVVGQVLPGLECDIRDDAGVSLKTGLTGTLWVKGGNVMMGYYHAEDQTKKVLQDGWLNTGDLASFDTKGNLAIRGRSKDLIIHKGFNIYPQEVENVLKHSRIKFRSYSTLGLRDDSDFLLWFASESLEEIQSVISKLYLTVFGKYIYPSHVYLSNTRPSAYTKKPHPHI